MVWGDAPQSYRIPPGGVPAATVSCVVASRCRSARLISPRSALAWQLSAPRLHRHTSHAALYAYRWPSGSINGIMWCTCTASVVILPCARHQRHRPPSRRRTSARVRCHRPVLRMRAAASALGALAGRCGQVWPRLWTPPHHLQDTSTPPPPENKKGQPARTWAACPALSL